jgi:hypothetical protein
MGRKHNDVFILGEEVLPGEAPLEDPARSDAPRIPEPSEPEAAPRRRSFDRAAWALRGVGILAVATLAVALLSGRARQTTEPATTPAASQTAAVAPPTPQVAPPVPVVHPPKRPRRVAPTRPTQEGEPPHPGASADEPPPATLPAGGGTSGGSAAAVVAAAPPSAPSHENFGFEQ